jgi:glycosyltransferase involved in cell wall biosynthesis
VPEDVVARLYANLARHYHHVKAQSRVGPLDRLFSFPKAVKVPRSRPHVLICFLGFHLGGGELVPIYLANALVDQGLTVSMLALDSTDENPEIRRLLRPCVPVYDAQLVEEIGVEKFLEESGVSLIHSHAVAVEFFFFQKHRIQPQLPYVVTLHGSYEVTPVPDDLMFRIIRCVSHWFYLADKNLAHLDGLGLDRKRLSRVNNGVPLDDRAFEPSREGLGLAPDTFVFAVASRALREKGWLEAVAALQLAQARTERRLHLLLCGDGKDLEAMKRDAEGQPGVSFLGYQDRIHGVYRLSDCVLLPSRFQGESLPLTLIQAMQVGKPIIASTMGQIPAMLERQGRSCGLLIDAQAPSDDAFVRELAQAMGRVLEPELAESLAEVSLAFGADYSAEGVAKRYADHYRRELRLSSPISLS